MLLIKSKNVPFFSRDKVKNSTITPKIIPKDSNESLFKKIIEYSNMNKTIDRSIVNAPKVNAREVVRA